MHPSIALLSLGLVLVLTGVLLGRVEAAVTPGAGRYFVAPNGNDAWSGRLPEPNADRTDGPFATLARAQEALRAEKGERTVYVRGGTYYLPEPLTLTPEDSGSRFLAYPGERPVLSGGRPITGWRKGKGEIWTVHLPEVVAGRWYFQQLRVGEERQIRARYPNFDPEHPYTGGWNFVTYTGPRVGAFGRAVGNIHTPGDWMEWSVDVPAEGKYKLFAIIPTVPSKATFPAAGVSLRCLAEGQKC
ncbi:MAG TPA: hypothetical protein EYP85_00990 [Armatimonadetes bacterium]|nr:hypothetical protein [Armatimonadota bacterium]